MNSNETEAVRHKQACADKMHSIIEQQHAVGREIQRSIWDAAPGSNWEIKPEHRQRLDLLIEMYAQARAEYFKAAEICDVTVYMKPFAPPPFY